jgi:hypothetical protein
MGLNKYRPFKDEFHDNGLEKRVTVPMDFTLISLIEIQYRCNVSSVSSVQVSERHYIK